MIQVETAVVEPLSSISRNWSADSCTCARVDTRSNVQSAIALDLCSKKKSQTVSQTTASIFRALIHDVHHGGDGM